MSNDKPMEGPGAGSEASGDHVINGIGDASSVSGPGSFHKLIHKGKAEGLLEGGDGTVSG